MAATAISEAKSVVHDSPIPGRYFPGTQDGCSDLGDLRINGVRVKIYSVFTLTPFILNREISETDAWDEEAIQRRASNLGEFVNKIWPSSLQQ